MPGLDEKEIYCPYCGELIEIVVDPCMVGSNYVEDCFVCCRPIEISMQEDAMGDIVLHVKTDTE